VHHLLKLFLRGVFAVERNCPVEVSRVNVFGSSGGGRRSDPRQGRMIDQLPPRSRACGSLLRKLRAGVSRVR
jgi:hypothetical protein